MMDGSPTGQGRRGYVARATFCMPACCNLQHVQLVSEGVSVTRARPRFASRRTAQKCEHREANAHGGEGSGARRLTEQQRRLAAKEILDVRAGHEQSSDAARAA